MTLSLQRFPNERTEAFILMEKNYTDNITHRTGHKLLVLNAGTDAAVSI
jgi:hypothetical protein